MRQLRHRLRVRLLRVGEKAREMRRVTTLKLRLLLLVRVRVLLLVLVLLCGPNVVRCLTVLLVLELRMRLALGRNVAFVLAVAGILSRVRRYR